MGYCTCLHLAVYGRGSIQHQTFDLEKLVWLVTSDHREAKATVTLLQLRVDEGSFELGGVSGEERLPPCTAEEELCLSTPLFHINKLLSGCGNLLNLVALSKSTKKKEKKCFYVWLLLGWEVELVGPEGPCRSPGG